MGSTFSCKFTPNGSLHPQPLRKEKNLERDILHRDLSGAGDMTRPLDFIGP